MTEQNKTTTIPLPVQGKDMDTVASVPEDGEKIIEIQLERLRTFKNHPFKIRMDQEMIRLSASVEKYGIQMMKQ